MQPGLISVVVWLSVLILWWSGWRKELAVGLPEWAVTLFLFLWPFAVSRTVALGSWGTVNLAMVLIVLAAMFVAISMTALRRWTVLAAGLLIGSVALFLTKLSIVIPSLMISEPRWYMAGLVGTIAVVLLRNPLEQWLSISVGLLLGAMADSWFRAEHEGYFVLGDSGWMAGWWLAIGCSRCLSYVSHRFLAAWNRLNFRRGGERS